MAPGTAPADRAPRRPRRAFRTCVVLVLLPALSLAAQHLRYDTEYPAIGYSTSTPTDAVARLQHTIDRGEVELEFDSKTGYLASLLRALKIDVASQLLVFSKTSFQTGLISPEAPRALYFGDDVYVGWVQRGPNIEISAVDEKLGAVFYTLAQEKHARPTFERQVSLCLRCHDTYSLTGGGVPRHLVGSGVTDRNGRTAFHAGWHLTSDRTPIEQRWGGWYVTGTHGDQRHLGNLIVTDAADAARPDLDAGANVTDLGTLFDTRPYLGRHSDIVGLMVMDHQIQVQNAITRVSYETRTIIHDRRTRPKERRTPGGDAERIADLVEPLVRALLLVGEAPLSDPIAGTSGFADAFVDLGPRDERGRSLRDLDLATRLFRYPCSYLIYSESFEGLPDVAKDHVYRRLWEVLRRDDPSDEFAHLSEMDRTAILEILSDTKPDFAASQPTSGIHD